MLPFENSIFKFEIRKQSILSILYEQIQLRIFKSLTKKSMTIFLRGNDLISASPQVRGNYEPDITAFINLLSKKGYNDFLIDIGANIGLTSCQNGKNFSEIHMFEPNPMCYQVLAVNAELTLYDSNYRIYPYGLGTSDSKAQLTIPKQNWGGAFIRDTQNIYNAQILAEKDGYKSLDPINYSKITVEVKSAKNQLAKLFSELNRQSLTNGVIKIDVEGFELEILLGIAHSIPSSISCYILFESWQKDFPIQLIEENFSREVSVGKLTKVFPWEGKGSLKNRLVSLLRFNKVSTNLCAPSENDLKGEIVLFLK